MPVVDGISHDYGGNFHASQAMRWTVDAEFRIGERAIDQRQ
jgi:hypothetical protein